MANTQYDFALGEYVPEPDDRDPILEQMKREEASLTLPISSGRMYMGPAMTPEEEAAFYRSAPGTSIVKVPAPIGPPEGRIGVPTEEEELARIKQGDIPGFTEAISFRRNVPMTIPEDPMAARFAVISEYQRMRAAGVPQQEAEERSGVQQLFAPTAYSAGRRYNVAGVGLVDQYGRVVTPAPQKTQRGISVPGVGLVNPVTGDVMVRAPEKVTETETIPATFGSEGVPAQPATSGFLGFGARPAVPAVPPTEERGERKITRTRTVETTTPKKITSKAEYDALPKGAIYIGKDGKRYRKP